jgi:DMSO/TMAO reductase YedYZ molybdopterin-dependent catalytic subunit
MSSINTPRMVGLLLAVGSAISLMMGLTALASLAACAPTTDPAAVRAEKWARASAVRTCANGTVVGLDPVTKTYLVDIPGWSGGLGDLSSSVTPDQFCDGAK